MSLSPAPPRNTATNIASRLRRRLRGLPAGSRLPPERQLRDELACSRETLRRALLELEKAGLIWRHVGQGTFVGPRPASEPIRPEILFAQSSPDDLMAARLVIEPAIAAAAARLATPGDIALLKKLASATQEADDWRSYEASDEAFHRALAAATNNRLLTAVLEMVSSVRGRSRWQRRHDAAFRAAHEREYSRTQGALHLAVVDAVAAGDPARAEAVMREHLTQIAALMTSRD